MHVPLSNAVSNLLRAATRRETEIMLVHPMQQSSIVAAGPVPRKSLCRPSLEKELDLASIFADDGALTPTSRDSPAEEIAGRTGEWCERNSVALLEACCNRDVVKGVWQPWVMKEI